jgi:hypothetical protein
MVENSGTYLLWILKSRQADCNFVIIFIQEKKIPILKKSKKLTILISYSIIVFALISCTTGNYGRLQSDREITQDFKDLKVLPDHKYYYRGTFSLPTVVVGIHKNFTLNLTLWTEIDTQSDDLKTLVNRVALQESLGASTVQPQGFQILDHAGDYVGIWYSALRTAAVQVNKNNEIVNLAPTGIISRRNER